MTQALVDWTWYVPGVFGIGVFALGLAAAVLAPRAGGVVVWRSGWMRWPRALALVLAAASVMAVLMADYEVRRARAVSQDSLREQLSAARTARSLNPLSVTPRYLEAAALEGLGRRREAGAALREALELEPRDFITVALLELAGDRERRHAMGAAARRCAERFEWRATADAWWGLLAALAAGGRGSPARVRSVSS